MNVSSILLTPCIEIVGRRERTQNIDGYVRILKIEANPRSIMEDISDNTESDSHSLHSYSR